MNRNTQVATVGVALAVLLLGVVWYQSQGSPTTSPSPSPTVKTEETTTSAILLEGGNAINVADQGPGTTVTVDLAVLEEGGYVVIHRATEDGKPGKVIGHTDYLVAAQYEDLEIELDEETQEGDVLFAMLHGDSDGDQEYGFPDEDAPLKDDEGNVILMKFEITSTPSEQ